MEPVSALAIVTGLVGSLDATLSIFMDFAITNASVKLDSDYASTCFHLCSVHKTLTQAQSVLTARSKTALLEELLSLLQDIERHLNKLKEDVQGVNHFHGRLMSRSIPRSERKAAVTSISLANDLIRMIRTTVQELVYGGQELVETERPSYQASSGPFSATSRPTHDWRLLNGPSSKAQGLLAWVRGPEGQRTFHEQCKAERITGTCEWFLNRPEFQSWVRYPSHRRERAIFWCQGEPGIGKTMLASKIIDHLQPMHVVAYFYMNHGIIHSASDLVISLLEQLYPRLRNESSRLQQIFGQTIGKTAPRLSFEKLLEALKEVINSTSQQITVVMDGLDETYTCEQNEFLQIFDSLKDTFWKCLVTSRAARDILLVANEDVDEFTMGDDANEEDIRKLVKKVLTWSEPIDRILESDKILRSRLENTLTLRAHGRFHWVNLQLRLILDQTSLSGIQSAMDSIPNEISQILDSNLKMIALQGKDRAELAKRALALLTVAQAPLTAEAMCHALGLAHILDYDKRPSKLIAEEIPDLESVIECCMGLIRIIPATRIVTIAQYDILQEMRERWASIFEGEHTARLARTCVAYLTLDEFSRGPFHEQSGFRTDHYPFLHYASRFWGDHARAALRLTNCDTDISNGIQIFLKQPMNLALSLQVSEYDLENKQKSFPIHPDQYLGVSDLQIASRHGLTKIVRNILKENPDIISKQDLDGRAALHDAAKAGWENIVRTLIDAGADSSSTDDVKTIPDIISKKDVDGRTALHDAVEAGWEDVVRILIDAGADSSSTDNEGKKPLFYAAEGGFSRIVLILQGQHERSDDDQKMLEEALIEAAKAARPSVVKELLSLDVNPDATTQGCSALLLACCRGCEAVVGLLLDAGASLSCRESSPSHLIPLHQAIRHGHVKAAALLLDYEVTLSFRDNLGRTALFEALDAPDASGGQLLLRHGIYMACPDFKGNTVLHEAVRKGASELADSVVQRGIPVDNANDEGLTPLHLATRYERSRLACILLEKGADVDRPDATGQTPLMYAMSTGNTELCQMLVDHGASAPPVKGGQENQLDLATVTGIATVSSKQSESAGLDHDVGIDERTGGSNAPLTASPEAGHTDIVTLLTNRGLDTKDLKTALELAIDCGHFKVLELLWNIREAT